jgi:hypothetical protein
LSFEFFVGLGLVLVDLQGTGQAWQDPRIVPGIVMAGLDPAIHAFPGLNI